jgi:hypothetical protein
MGGEQLSDIPWILALLVDLSRPRGDLLAGEPADQVAEVAQLFGGLVDP